MDPLDTVKAVFDISAETRKIALADAVLACNEVYKAAADAPVDFKAGVVSCMKAIRELH